MAPSNPKRPPRPPRPPGTQAQKDSDVELPFDDDEVDPLQADDPRPQRVPQFPAGSRRSRRSGGGERGSADRELQAPRFDWSHEYSDPGYEPAFVYVERGPGAGQLVPVKQGSLVLGRSSSADLRLQHPSISRRHAQLHRRGDRFFLKDLSSQNGTFVNRTRVTGEVELMPGDEVSMGNALLRLRGPGSTPAPGLPAIVTHTEVSRPRPRRLGTLSVAVLAAIVGSSVAALVTVLAIHLSDEEDVAPEPPPKLARPVPSVQVPAGEETPPPASPPVETAPSPSMEAAETPAPEEASANEETAGAHAAGSLPQPAVPAAGSPPPRTEGPSALDVARGTLKARTGGEAPRSAMEVEVLKRYVAGDVASALERARVAKLRALHIQLSRFTQADAEARKALSKRDVTRAISELTTAVSVDEALAPNGSKHGPRLRKRLSALHEEAGIAHARAGRQAAARESFEQALKHDAGNHEARERLEGLSASAAP